jgi:phosphonate transport system ATP-binding protein
VTTIRHTDNTGELALTPAVEVQDLWLAYRPGEWVLKSVELRVPRGQLWVVMGPSGAGKTTLMKALAGLLPFQRGTVEVMGFRLQGEPPRAFRRVVGYIPQQLGLVRGLTALENVLLGALGRHGGLGPTLGLFPRQEVTRARDYLAMLGLGDKAGTRVFNLSGGERQRVAIARTLMQDPQLILADEFVSDLDLPRAARILETIRGLVRERGLTLLMNLHEIQLVRELADHVVVLKDGRIVHQGPAGALGWSDFRALTEDGGAGVSGR